MGFKIRGYDKESLQSKTRDYSLFAIACEGTEREPQYFKPLNAIDRIKVDIIGEGIRDTASSPGHILWMAQEYIRKNNISPEYGDTLWLVVDVDKWTYAQLNELNRFCKQSSYCHLAISNPCFEIWLLYHKCKSLDLLICKDARQTKQVLHQLEEGGYNWRNYLPLLEEATENAAKNDSDSSHYYPGKKETKVYQLGKALLDRIGKLRFRKFVEQLKTNKKHPSITS